MPKKFTADDAGCYLDGCMGWHNTWRAVNLARDLGWKPSYEGASKKSLALYRRQVTRAVKFYAAGDTDATLNSKYETLTYDQVAEWITGQGGLCDEATDYLNTLVPEGYVFNWDMGELSLIPESEMEF
jgi:hypothetical protein